jgi:hypothetical protein
MTYATTILANSDPAGTSLLTSPDHAAQHSTVNDDLTQVELKIGLGAGSPTTANMLLVATGNGTSVWGGTVNNATFGTPTIGTPSITGGTIVGYQSTYHTLGSAASSPGAATTGTLNLQSASRFLVNMPNAAGQVTLAVSNVTANQPFLVEILQAASGLGTINWFSTIRWAGNSVPTQTLTANRKDSFGFIATGSGTYDGFIVGQNL